MRNTIAVVAALVTLTACGDTPTEPDPLPPGPLPVESMAREWMMHVIPKEGLVEEWFDGGAVEGEGIIDETRRVGVVGLSPPGRSSSDVFAEVYSSEDGGTYWVWAEAPDIFPTNPPVWPEPLMGSSARLRQGHAFRKLAADAELAVVVTKIELLALDGNGDMPSVEECSWFSGGRPIGLECEKLLSSSVVYEMGAYQITDDGNQDVERVLLTTGGVAHAFGFTGSWRGQAWPKGPAIEPLWRTSDFDLVEVPNGQGLEMLLSSPITIEIPLDSVPVGGLVALGADVEVRAVSRRGRESYVGAFLRDPLAAEGTVIEFEGLEPTDLTGIPQAPVPVLTCGSGGAPPTGTMQFDSIEYYEPEQPGVSAWITVSREGGSDGVAAVRVLTRDFTAEADEDYVAGESLVVFGDGEVGVRVVEVPIVADTVIEPPESFYVDLARVPGCGELGTPRTATVHIEDDDTPPPETETYTVGGTVVGLEGSGLELYNLGVSLEIDRDGPWAFPREWVTGVPYTVRIDRQPSGPNQMCTVANHEGKIADADVSDVLVECTNVESPIDYLDDGFGFEGSVSADLNGGAQDLVLLPDGKILVLAENALARYDVDGTPDVSFGVGGELPLDLDGETVTMRGMVMDGDDAIVVGYTLSSAAQDWAIARITANGSPDTSFGTNGWARLDFFGYPDRAFGVAVQSGGEIVVGGHAQSSGQLGRDNDFAVARFTTDGDLDTSFGSGGTALLDIAGLSDFAYALALQADDAIVLAGRVANRGGDDPDFGVARFEADGALDTTFGTDGIHRLVTDDVWDEAADVLVHPDGHIVVGGFQQPRGTSARFFVMQLDAAGDLDTTFGSSGEGAVNVDISGDGDYLEALAFTENGIVAVGQAANQGDSDFAIVWLRADGTLGYPFSLDGSLVVDFFGSSDVAQAVAVQPDGRFVVGGLARSGSTYGLGLLRTIVPR